MQIIVQIIIAFAAVSLAWLIWQLMKAKRFTRFKLLIDEELKAKVIESIIADLNESRSEIFPNNEYHQQATIFYWTQYKSRILHAALQREIISEQWLKETGNLRNAQHLFFVEQAHLPKP